MKIKIAVVFGRRFIAPGIKSCRSRSFGASVRCTMELSLGGQFSAQPIRVSRRFRVAHVNWPITGQSHFAKHSAIQPQISVLPPEGRVLDVVGGFPAPGFVIPQ